MPSQPIAKPRRILVLGSDSDSGVLPFLKALTGSAPTARAVHHAVDTTSTVNHEADTTPPKHDEVLDETATTAPTSLTTAGLTHTLALSNAYYTADIPIWIDETPTPSEWSTDFQTPEAGDVVRAIGAWIIVFRLPPLASPEQTQARETLRELLGAVQAAIRAAYDGDESLWEGVCLAVGWPSGVILSRESEPRDMDARDDEMEMWEDLCFDYGFEFVHGGKKGRNEMRELQGIERVKEALEANEWDGADAEGEDGLFDELEDENDAEQFGDLVDAGTRHDTGFNLEQAEMEREFLGLKMGMLDDRDREDTGTEAFGEAHQVEELERIMGKLMAVKDMSAHLPKEQRRRHAAKAVNDLMKTT